MKQIWGVFGCKQYFISFFFACVFVKEEVILTMAHNTSTEIIRGNLPQTDGTFHLLCHGAL